MSGIGIMSVFFNIDKSASPVDNHFLAFLTDPTKLVDLSQLFPADISLTSMIHGYIGTNT